MMMAGSNKYLQFNIDEVEEGNEKYNMLIEDLREFARNSAPHSLLPVDLITGKDTITLQIEPENLYLRGYFAGTGCWEFSDSSLIPGSKSLPYPLLLGPDALYRNSCLKASPLGCVHLQDAITHLANYPPASDAITFAKSIVIVMQMVTEAAKIQLIAEHVGKNWLTPTPIEMHMRSIQTAFEMDNFTPLMQGFICKYSSNLNIGLAFNLVAVEYVLVKGFKGHIYGTVSVVDSCRENHVICEHDSSLSLGKSKGEAKRLVITGPSAPVSGHDFFFFKVRLHDSEGEIVDEEIDFDPIREYKFNQKLVGCASGIRGSGSVSVGFSIVRRALFATVKVVMLNKDGKSPDLYGNITASYILKHSSESELWKRMLFVKSKNEPLQGSPQQSIPLTCPVFPVPEVSKLKIKVFLRSPDGLFMALGTAQFPTFNGTHTLFGTQLVNLLGPRGGVQVSFTCCSPDFYYKPL